MTLFLDARVPVLFGDATSLEAGDAMLLEGDAPGLSGHPVARFAAGAAHPAGCACCLPRSAVAEALGRLFLARARGEVTFFSRVVADVTDEQPVREALAGDIIVSGRYRLL